MEASALAPVAFLDRDGVLNVDHGYVFKVSEMELPEGAPAGLRQLTALGFRLLVVSNQGGVARGFYTEADVKAFNQALKAKYESEYGITLEAFYHCPHYPSGTVEGYARECHCRKPQIGMLEQAGRDFAIDWARSIMIGDKDSDVQCAINAGLFSVQIVTGSYATHAHADLYAPNLTEAAAAVACRMATRGNPGQP
jgi:D-glycero-D-manno-heptose 1,7-bisphosphate phosphatase